jgi:hypothetical protein
MPKHPTLGQRHLSFWQARISDTYYVYVIRAGKKDPVKIGKARNPMHRLKTLQTGNAQILRLLLVVPAGEESQAKKLERVLHERFAEHRLGTSEWFYGPGVKQVIDFVTELAVEMVQAHEDGSYSPPTLGGFPGWTEEERRALQPDLATIPMTESSLPLTERERRRIAALAGAQAEDGYNLVPTIRSRVCRTMLRAPQHNGACTQ